MDSPDELPPAVLQQILMDVRNVEVSRYNMREHHYLFHYSGVFFFWIDLRHRDAVALSILYIYDNSKLNLSWIGNRESFTSFLL